VVNILYGFVLVLVGYDALSVCLVYGFLHHLVQFFDPIPELDVYCLQLVYLETIESKK